VGGREKLIRGISNGVAFSWIIQEKATPLVFALLAFVARSTWR
jgi:hypothetical protein